MIQILTIRQQILSALQRVYDSMGFDELLSADRIEKELLAAFHPTAFATTPTDGFDEMALKLGYIKLEPGQCVVQAELLEAVIADMRNDCDCSEGYCNNECGGGNCHVKDLTAALDASGVGR